MSLLVPTAALFTALAVEGSDPGAGVGSPSPAAARTVMQVRASLLSGDWSWFSLLTVFERWPVALGLSRWLLAAKDRNDFVTRVVKLRPVLDQNIHGSVHGPVLRFETVLDHFLLDLLPLASAGTYDEAREHVDRYGILAHHLNTAPNPSRYIQNHGTAFSTNFSWIGWTLNWTTRLRKRTIDLEDFAEEARKAWTAGHVDRQEGWAWTTTYGGSVGKAYKDRAETEAAAAIFDPEGVLVIFAGRIDAHYPNDTQIFEKCLPGLRPVVDEHRYPPEKRAQAFQQLIVLHRLARMSLENWQRLRR